MNAVIMNTTPIKLEEEYAEVYPIGATCKAFYSQEEYQEIMKNFEGLSFHSNAERKMLNERTNEINSRYCKHL